MKQMLLAALLLGTAVPAYAQMGGPQFPVFTGQGQSYMPQPQVLPSWSPPPLYTPPQPQSGGMWMQNGNFIFGPNGRNCIWLGNILSCN